MSSKLQLDVCCLRDGRMVLGIDEKNVPSKNKKNVKNVKKRDRNFKKRL